MKFPDRFALLHTLWFLAVLVAVFVATPLLAARPTGILVGLIVAISSAGVFLPLLWAHGIYNLAAQTGGGRFGRLAFPVVELAIVVGAILAFGSGNDGPTGVLGAFIFLPVLGYFFCLWLAAAALVRSESSERKSALAPTLGTFVLMIYWMIGAWFIRPRVKRLTERLEADPRSA
jgi:hypothetical protein